MGDTPASWLGIDGSLTDNNQGDGIRALDGAYLQTNNTNVIDNNENGVDLSLGHLVAR